MTQYQIQEIIIIKIHITLIQLLITIQFQSEMKFSEQNLVEQTQKYIAVFLSKKYITLIQMKLTMIIITNMHIVLVHVLLSFRHIIRQLKL